MPVSLSPVVHAADRYANEPSLDEPLNPDPSFLCRDPLRRSCNPTTTILFNTADRAVTLAF